jgi:protein gp37
MSKTTIEWTQRPGTVGETWNPTTGCSKVDRGCKNCYAEVMHRRLQKMMPDKYREPFLAGAVEHPETLTIPYGWKKPRTVFVDSMSDLFHKNVSLDFLRQVFAVMRDTAQHTYLILTKRPERIMDFLLVQDPAWEWPRNVWMGTSVNDQESADKRIPALMFAPAPVRFVSYEPATGPVDLTRWLGSYDRVTYRYDETGKSYVYACRFVAGIDWVICGGESGAKAVPMHPDWARNVRDHCALHHVPFFFKQWGNWEPITYYKEHTPIINFTPGKGEYLFPAPRPQNMIRVREKSRNLLDGRTHLEFPNTQTPTP